MAYDFKDEGEVKEFIKNLGIEYRFGCYSEKKPEGTDITSLSKLIFYKITQNQLPVGLALTPF